MFNKMIYPSAQEEFIILLNIIMQFKVLIALYSKSQNLERYAKEYMTHVGYVVDSKMRFIRN